MSVRSRILASSYTKFSRDTNQALGIGEFSISFMRGDIGESIDPSVYDRVKLFHTDSVLCGVSALAMGTNAPTLLREEALKYADKHGSSVFGSRIKVAPEKAICANSAAVREWDSNGTVFGFNPKYPGHQAGEFGHNDFYPVIIAAAQQVPISGRKALKAMILSDEIRGRLAEVFSLKTHKIDHVVHGAIASAAVYGALLGATAEQIEAAIGMTVAHYIPWRAIRAGKQLSDSKGASAAISTEAAVLSMRRAMNGFLGPRDIFRNPESIFRFFENTSGDSPFDILLSHAGNDFAVMGMHFKLGLYEHQSAGALQAVVDLLLKNPQVLKDTSQISNIAITAYEPAFGIIGDPAKRSPKTRQSADHSMVFIVSRFIQRAVADAANPPTTSDEAWKRWMLTPNDYGKDALNDNQTKALMEKISFVHGGPEYDRRYPDGIPTSVSFQLNDGTSVDSGLVMYPSGHARNDSADLAGILDHKFHLLGGLALPDKELNALLAKLQNLEDLNEQEVASLYSFDWKKLKHHHPIDG